MRLEKCIEIAVPPQKLWPFLIEPKKIMKWFTYLKRYEYTSRKHSGVGTTFFYVEKFGRRVLKLNFKVVEWVDNKTLAFIMTSGPLKKDDQIWSIRATQSTSILTLTIDFELPWIIIGKIMERLFIGRILSKHLEEVLFNLKKLVERQ